MTKRWIYRPQEHDDWGIVRDADRDDCGFHRVICQANYVASPDELTAHRINGTDPAEANARLIAAAPDLLTAGEKALHELDAAIRCVSHAETRTEMQAVADELRAAITKATPEDRS